jgi:chemosensory pili system protein ChpA (sensor histidine kinase/response regulator)
LPFSLAVTQALLVKLGSDTYAVPLLSIESVVRLSEGDLQAYIAGKSVEYSYGTYSYPIHNLGILLGANTLNPHEDIADKKPPALLFRTAEASAALQVEAVLGNQEIIVKPLPVQFQLVPGISGATMLADGRVIVVLDLADLVRNINSRSRGQEAKALSTARAQSLESRIKAMVIDDSITMRKVTCRFLERHGISATAAKDGVEAIAKLEEFVPDFVILDIEMPRMDGFEVAAHIRNQPHLKHMPVIMVTSRGGEKHRQRAAKFGVNAYLTKPYQEEEMLRTIKGLIGEDIWTALEMLH